MGKEVGRQTSRSVGRQTDRSVGRQTGRLGRQTEAGWEVDRQVGV